MQIAEFIYSLLITNYVTFMQERSGKIVKEVTETTVLRVSHDIRLDVASYKCISNIVEDHRQHTDVKDIQNVERVLLEELHDENHVHHDLDQSVSSQYFILMTC